MLRRLQYVLLNYATRPMVWALAAIYIVALGLMIESSWQPSGRQQVYPKIASWGRTASAVYVPGMEVPDRDDAVHVEIRWPTAVAAPEPKVLDEFPVGDSSARYLQQLQAFPKLRALTLHDRTRLFDDEVEAIGELKQLEGLTLLRCGLRAEHWKQLGRLPRLRYLDLSGCNLWGDYPDLETLSNLETLILGSPESGGIVENDALFMPELRRLPRLKTIVVNSHYYSLQTMREARRHIADGSAPPIPAATDLPRENVNHLRAISTLQSLFVFERAPGDPDFDKLQRDLPSVKVRPSYVDVDRQYSILAVVFLNSVLYLLLAMQVLSHFSQAAAHLVPNYVGPHIIPVVGLWLFGILVNTVPLLLRQVPIGPALGLSLLYWGLICGLGLMAPAVQVGSKRMRWVKISLVVAAIGLGTSYQSLFQWNWSSIDWYLRGREPGWAWLFIVAGIVASAELLRRSLRLHSLYLELGVHSPPLGHDPVAWAAWQQEINWRLQSSGKLTSWNWRVKTWRMERAIAQSTQPGWRHRSDLWIVGNAGDGNSALLIGIVLAMSFIVATILWPRDDNTGFASFLTIQNPLILFQSIFLADLPVIGLAGLWRQRRKFFAIESLRPLSRIQFARQIATAIAWDLLPVGGVYLAVLTWYVAQADPQRWSVAWTAAMLLVFVARWIALYGLMLWGITIRRNWVLVLTGTIAAYAVLFANIVIIFLQAPIMGVEQLPTDMPDIGVLALAAMALGFGAIACVMTRFAYQRWQRIELV